MGRKMICIECGKEFWSRTKHPRKICGAVCRMNRKYRMCQEWRAADREKKLLEVKPTPKRVVYGGPINESESVAFDYLVRKGHEPLRKVGGCDFRLGDKGPLVEVKTNVLRPSQIREMSNSFKKSQSAYLLIITEKRILQFILLDVEDIFEGVSIA
jgi:hypothetical protein